MGLDILTTLEMLDDALETLDDAQVLGLGMWEACGLKRRRGHAGRGTGA